MSAIDLHDWFTNSFWTAYTGYNSLFSRSYSYKLYIGNDVQGEHSFFFALY
jgi:hypothetical protein